MAGTLKKLWWAILPPKEVSATRAHVRSALAKHAQLSSPAIQAEIARSHNVAVTVHAIRKQGVAPDILALLLIRNAIESMLRSGQFHVYRGTLSSVGRDMRAALRRVVAELRAKGQMNDVDDGKYFAWIDQEVKNVG